MAPPPIADNARQTLDLMSRILGCCFLTTVVAMLFVWGVYLVAGELIHRSYSLLVEMTRQEFDKHLLHFMTLIKCLNVVLFFIPWFAIRLLLWRDRNYRG